ncbi:TonB-dependent receptor [Flavicella marina]|uniref:TonB-dependent receptor n=1 Tax=Flavicella marina TaxID=1475951 RepID=UPI0012659CB8|nr:TonB-dependent receptor [Flavicella marina]
MKIKYLFFWIVIVPNICASQMQLKGMVMSLEETSVVGLPGATVFWLGTSIGTHTNEKGWFELPFTDATNQLVLSFVGYETDTIEITKKTEVHHFLKPKKTLDEVVVNGSVQATSTSFYSPLNKVSINEAELLKAACCNLSESFETNPIVGVSYSDALSGVKQIEMLGLTSPYISITQENIPSVRGASQVYGMSFIPGTWIESIQVTKGTGSVVNGFESISGQINTELKKPRGNDSFFLNLYGSGAGRIEINTHLLKKVTENWSTGMFLHGNTRSLKIDRNADGFLDVPIGRQINLMNRWQYTNPSSGWVSFIDFKYVSDQKQIGEVLFEPKKDKFSTIHYGGEIGTERIEAAAKLGYVFDEKPYQSFGLQASYSQHRQDSYFGLNRYDIEQHSYYFNSIFQSILFNTMHTFKTGLSGALDIYQEQVNSEFYNRNEKSIGSFFEYTYDNIDDITVVAGVRFDYHSVMGFTLVPRLHVRYEPWRSGVFKFALGKGQRMASVFTENQKMFASSRNIIIESTDSKGAYGLSPEVAWNYGLSYLHKLKLFYHDASFSVDYFITDFQNQVVVDYDASPQEVRFYNLNGGSQARSFQVQLDFELNTKLNFRFAYKNNDVQVTYNKGVLRKALQPTDLYFANMEFKSKQEKQNQWKWDVTYSLIGKQRIPNTESNPIEYRMDEWSSPYSLLNSQVTYVLSKKLDFYVGGENLLNVTQKKSILGVDDPFGDYFDTTLLYAPVVGSMYYAGLRYNL